MALSKQRMRPASFRASLRGTSRALTGIAFATSKRDRPYNEWCPIFVLFLKRLNPTISYFEWALSNLDRITRIARDSLTDAGSNAPRDSTSFIINYLRENGRPAPWCSQIGVTAGDSRKPQVGLGSGGCNLSPCGRRELLRDHHPRGALDVDRRYPPERDAQYKGIRDGHLDHVSRVIAGATHGASSPGWVLSPGRNRVEPT